MQLFSWSRRWMNRPADVQTRRSFLGRLLGIPLAGAASGVTRPPWATPVYALDEFYVAGFRYHEGPRLVSRLAPGEMLELVAEPDNPHDPNAVRISWRGAKLGYVPRAINGHITRLLAQEAPIECRVTHVVREAEPWRTLRVAVTLVISVQEVQG